MVEIEERGGVGGIRTRYLMEVLTCVTTGPNYETDNASSLLKPKRPADVFDVSLNRDI